MSFSLKPGDISVAIEGTDAAGKKTQSLLLQKWLADQLGGEEKVFLVDVPRYETSIGKIIKGMLQGDFGPTMEYDVVTSSMLFALDRREAFSREITQAVKARKVIVSNRWRFSNAIHQAAKVVVRPDLYPKGIDYFIETLLYLEGEAFETPDVSLNIVLTLPPVIIAENIRRRAAELGGSMDEHEKSIRYQEAVCQVIKLMLEDGGRRWPISTLVEVPCADASGTKMRPPEEIALDVAFAVKAHFPVFWDEDLLGSP